VGSKTELALLLMLLNLGHSDYKDIRKQAEAVYSRIHPFSSKRKRSSVVVAVGDTPDRKRVHVKGASEYIVARCTKYLNHDGEPQEITPEIRDHINAVIGSMADSALRTIGLAYNELDPSANPDAMDEAGEPLVEAYGLTLICIVGIKDPIREEVPGAVKKCKAAGIRVRMVTGDNVATARAIAKECHIITSDNSLVMEGSEFDAITGGTVCKNCQTAECLCPRDARKAKSGEEVREDVVKNLAEFTRIVDRLDVMARSRPNDKYTLVVGLR
jgi:Ca2+ transporting ATPase